MAASNLGRPSLRQLHERAHQHPGRYPLQRPGRSLGFSPRVRKAATATTAVSAGGAIGFGSSSGFLQQAASVGGGAVVGHQLIAGTTLAAYGVAALALAWVLFREEDDNDSGGGGGPGNGVPVELYVRIDENEYGR